MLAIDPVIAVIELRDCLESQSFNNTFIKFDVMMIIVN